MTTPNGDFPLAPDCLSPSEPFPVPCQKAHTSLPGGEPAAPLNLSQHGINLRLSQVDFMISTSQQSAWPAQVSFQQRDHAPAHVVGNMLIRGVGTGAPCFVTSHLRGLSALSTRWSYCPPCLQWEDSEDHNVDQRMAK